MPAYVDITNQKFGRLTALKQTSRRRRGFVLWLCQCDCGKHIYTTSTAMRRGHTKSCGCLKTDMLVRRLKTHDMSQHGKTRTPEYYTWLLLRSRCRNPNDRAYKNYGGRGIMVCGRWDSFENFLADMGPRPVGYSIERVNNDGNYEPSNCKWIPLPDQSKNKRRFGSR